MPSHRARIASAALLVGLSLWAASVPALAGPSPSAATAEQSTEATRLYTAGVAQYKAGKLAEALAQFEASYAVVASPNSHLMVARVRKERGEPVEAYRAYQETEREAQALLATEPKYQVAADAAHAALAELASSVGLVTVRVTGGELRSLTVGPHAIPEGARAEPVPVAPGTVVVSGVAGDGRKVTRSVEVAAGATADVALDLAPAAPSGPIDAPPPASDASGSGVPLVPFVITGAVVGAAGFAIFGAFGAMNNATYSDLEATCPGDRCAADRQDLIDEGRTQQLVANIGLGVGAVGMAAAATFLIVELATDGSDGPENTAISVGPGSVLVRGTF